MADVGGKITDQEAFFALITKNEMTFPWRGALSAGQEMRIYAQLNQVFDLGMPGQLGVGGLVNERGRCGWIRRFNQKIGIASPILFEQRCLIDDIRAVV